MSVEIISTNPVVKAIISGTAPAPALFAAARGVLPLPQTDLLEILVHLATGSDAELASTAQTTLNNQETNSLTNILESVETAPVILSYFAEKENLPAEIYDAVISNTKTPDNSIIKFARQTQHGDLLELIALNQQRLIRIPAIIDAIIANPFRTVEAERRATETKLEFFEKERGAKQIANELRARGQEGSGRICRTSRIARKCRSISIKY